MTNKNIKEYPATHSMWTAWFAVDLDGNVAIMECDDNGPVPLGVNQEIDSDELILESIIADPTERIDYTKEQLEGVMANAMSATQYIPTFEYFEGIWGVLCEIDASKLHLLEDAVKASPKNQLICVSTELNLWYVNLSLPHYLDNSGDKRYRPTKKKNSRERKCKSTLSTYT